MITVHSPVDPGAVSFNPLIRPCFRDRMADLHLKDERYEAYDIRVRAAALIHECTKPPKDPCNPDLPRLQSIDTMLSNLLVRAQSVWANIATTSTRPSPPFLGALAPGAPRSQQSQAGVETKLEVIFTAMVVLHAARIHLHRQAWFSDLTMDFESCSFKQKPTASEVPSLSNGSPSSVDADGCDCERRPSILSVEERRNRIAASVTKIVSVSTVAP